MTATNGVQFCIRKLELRSLGLAGAALKVAAISCVGTGCEETELLEANNFCPTTLLVFWWEPASCNK